MDKGLEYMSESTRSLGPVEPQDTANPPAVTSTQDGVAEGRVTKIRGGVVDVFFTDQIPRIQDLLYAGDLALEVASLLDNGTVRCIALAPVRGMGLGMPVRATGAPIQVPVGEAVLGRMLNVFGQAIDGKPEPTAAARRSIHQPPPPLEERVVHSAILETGIKAIDLLSPIERGGKTGLFGGAGVGKTVLINCVFRYCVARIPGLSLTGPSGCRSFWTG